MSRPRKSRTLQGTPSACKTDSIRLRLEPLEERSTPTVAGTFIGAPFVAAGPAVNISRMPGNQSEMNIAIDPTNPAHMFAVAVLDGSGLMGAVSNDAGRTWTPRTIADNTDGLPEAISDGQLAWDSFGNLFLTYVTNFNPNAESIVALSTDGGRSFRVLFNSGGALDDQPSLAVGPGTGGVGNTLWLAFNDGNMIVRGAQVTGLGAVGPFSAAVTPPNASGNFGNITVGPNGQVMITYQDNTTTDGPENIYVNTDPDGLGPAPFGARVTVTATNVGGFDSIPPQSSRTVDAEANLAFDRQGRVYLVYTDETPQESDNTDIFVRFSDDSGATWSAPVKVNDDAGTKSQFLDAIAVDQDTGVVAVTWHDSRNSPTDTQAQFFGSVSTNRGTSFVTNVALGPGLSDAAAANNFIDYGDYSGLFFFGGSFFPIWADNSNSTGDNPDGTLSSFDAYTARGVVRSAGGETITATGGAASDTYVVRRDSSGTYLQIYENNPTLSGRPTFTATYGAVNTLAVNGNGGNDQLILDYSNGDPVPLGGITFNGAAGIDVLQVSGAPAASFATTGAGAGVFSAGGANVTLAGVEQINAALAGGPFAFTATNNADAITIGPAADGAQIASAGSPTIAISGASSVTVDGAGGSDVFNVNAAGVALPLIIQGGPPTTAPGDVLNVNFTGAPHPTLIVTGPDSGIYVFPGHPSITFNGIETNLSPQVRTRGPQAIVAVGVDSGAPPIVQVVDAESGQLLYRILAYPVGFAGGVRVAVGDVNGDLIPDIITAPGRGAAPLIKVFDGRTGSLMRAFFAYPSNVTTGVNVAAGDVNGDGVADIIAAPDRGAMPLVEVFDGRTGALNRAFVAFTPGFRGGLHVAAGLVNGDKFAEIIVAASSGPPIVETFDGRSGGVMGAFLAYAPTLRSGVWVTTGDVNADGLDDIITGPNGPAPPLVRVFDASGNSLLTFRAFQTFQPAGISDGLVMSGGARVGALDVNRDGVPEIVIAQGPGSPALLVEYSNVPLSLVGIVQVFSAGFGRGVNIGASN